MLKPPSNIETYQQIIHKKGNPQPKAIIFRFKTPLERTKTYNPSVYTSEIFNQNKKIIHKIKLNNTFSFRSCIKKRGLRIRRK